MAALRQSVQSLRYFTGKKSVMFFSEGFLLENSEWALQEVVNAALRCGVVIHTLDPRGLYTPLQKAEEQVFVGSPPLLALKSLLHGASLQAQGIPLRQMALDTGGLSIQDNNDLYAGLKSIAEGDLAQYILTYAAPVHKADGQFHAIQIKLARPGVELSYRRGYYEVREQISTEQRSREEILEVMRAPGSLTDIPLKLSYHLAHLEESRFSLAIRTEVNLRRVKFLLEDHRFRNNLHLVVAAFDEHGNYVDGVEKIIQLNLTKDSFLEMQKFGLSSRVEMILPTGHYRFKIVARDEYQNQFGSLTEEIAVP
jgi:hypothetical protein